MCWYACGSPLMKWGLCEYVIVHTILGGSPVILWISLGGKPKWLPLKFGYHDVMRTSPIQALPVYPTHRPSFSRLSGQYNKRREDRKEIERKFSLIPQEAVKVCSACTSKLGRIRKNESRFNYVCARPPPGSKACLRSIL